jgi:hypothetical protein
MNKKMFASTIRTGFRLLLCALFVTVSFSGVGHAHQTDSWEKAHKETVRLVPAAFPHLPDPIVRDLNERRCSIPQPWDSSRPQNVVSGEFRNPGQTDWAILCSVKEQSVILVYWGGSTDKVEEIPGSLSEDRKWLLGVGENRIGYSRLITAADDGYLLDQHEYYPAGAIHFVDSVGIVGTASKISPAVRYWHEGQWVELHHSH